MIAADWSARTTEAATAMAQIRSGDGDTYRAIRAMEALGPEASDEVIEYLTGVLFEAGGSPTDFREVQAMLARGASAAEIARHMNTPL
ncbi:hypothetical protein JQC91_02010 [Jannaschia sp. Os4]|uniref:hypothetical protein n=1 Tax=Jannaschia sp. Os4 TaxID=2807617 RepID=UPI0019397663|nr:hypothetical protein [Jannaschia sp. Os4]MBM2575068.1 hypothetical protein [Jannaschia sp. Os4]